MRSLPILFAVVATGFFTDIADAGAQGISNSRDPNGNLVERGAATRTYPAAPMANSTIAQPPPQGYVVIAHGRTVKILPRR